jgi:hypothetical protein
MNNSMNQFKTGVIVLMITILGISLLIKCKQPGGKYTIIYINGGMEKKEVIDSKTDSDAYKNAATSYYVSKILYNKNDTFKIMNVKGEVIFVPKETKERIDKPIIDRVTQLKKEAHSALAGPHEFIDKIKENKAVIDADITDVGFLYIAVLNDGQNKDAMATYYCRLAREFKVTAVKSVKIVDVATAKLPKNGTAIGEELGISHCQ